MVACIVIASLLSFFSIFAFFGRTFGNDLNIGPNMFDLMFGNDGWKRFDGMTVLFFVQILVMLVAIDGFFVAYKVYSQEKDEKSGKTVAALSIIFSLIATIMSFCTLPITETVDTGARLGLGPILYSVLHILSIFIFITGILYSHSKNRLAIKESSQDIVEKAYFSSQMDDEDYSKKYLESLKANRDYLEAKSNNNASVKTNSTKRINDKVLEEKLTENEKAELIFKYKSMLDQGILTQEEFEAKKKQLLQ